MVVDGSGNLKLRGKQTTPIPVKIRANLTFLERAVRATGQPTRGVRLYQQANATLQVANTTLSPRLSGDRAVVAVELARDKAKAPILFSPLGPLTRDELELLTVPANSLAVPGLLPSQAVVRGLRWQHDEPTVAAVLNLDAVDSTRLESRVVDVSGELARVEISGSVAGAVGGVATTVDVSGDYSFHITERRVTRLVWSVREQREIGNGEPGFDVKLRVRMTAEPQPIPPALSDEQLEQLVLKAEPGSQLLLHSSRGGGFRVLVDRRWRIMAHLHDRSLLRLVDNDRSLAQCNIVRLADMPEGRQMPLETFQDDVKESLGKNLQQLIEASQSTTEDGLQVLRVVASGISSDVPIRWIYYHVGNRKGQRVALAFTLEEKLVESFAAVDVSLLASLEVFDRDEESGKQQQ